MSAALRKRPLEIVSGDELPKRRQLEDAEDNILLPSPSVRHLSHSDITERSSINTEFAPAAYGENNAYNYAAAVNNCSIQPQRASPQFWASECCYGMITRIPVEKIKPGLDPSSAHISVSFASPDLLTSTDKIYPIDFKITSTRESHILVDLVTRPEVSIQLYCYSETCQPSSKLRKIGRLDQSWSLNAILYGALELKDAIGDFLCQKRIYLQDPVRCDRNVLYENPHMVSQEIEELVMTKFFESSVANVEIEQIDVGPDLLSELLKDEIPLQETGTPEGLSTPLFAHQKQALTFMLRRERGWALKEPNQDIWNIEYEPSGRFRYRNNVTRSIQYEAPADFCGGLLADDMGLGKTLSMISLIVANRKPRQQSQLLVQQKPHFQHNSSELKTTLLIVPPSLMKSWEKQLQIHVQPGLLKCYIYHGQNRKDIGNLGEYDVVITSYYTVSEIWRQKQHVTDEGLSIFAVCWYRVILDEAHIIQNRQSQLARACCALVAQNRWAITGTPIQNKLTDFASIVEFLRVYPYSQQSSFAEDISKPWQNGFSDGFLRLKTLVRHITIARTKAVINLPQRTDEIRHLTFNSQELQKYEQAKTQVGIQFEEPVSSDAEGKDNLNALQRLNILRLICSHGLLAQLGHSNNLPEEPQDTFWNSALTCAKCGETRPTDNTDTKSTIFSDLFSNDRVLCTCADDTRTAILAFERSVDRPRLQYNRSGSSSAPASSTPIAEGQESIDLNLMSTKVKALITDILAHHHNEKSVVFSFWTYTLDLVEKMLDHHKVLYTRIDGKMPLSRRTAAMEAFQDNDMTRVILVSIMCGGAGLDLTAGSRAYILEPHWNPMIEEQALCRIHRVGQSRNVTTVRYIMKDSFEEQVIEIQKRKKMLARLTFSGDTLAKVFDTGILQYLKAAIE